MRVRLNSAEASRRRLAVRVATVEDSLNDESLGFLNIANAVVTDTQAAFAGIAFQGFHVAHSRFRESLQHFKDAHCGWLIQSADVGSRMGRECNSLHPGTLG